MKKKKNKIILNWFKVKRGILPKRNIYSLTFGQVKPGRRFSW